MTTSETTPQARAARGESTAAMASRPGAGGAGTARRSTPAARVGVTARRGLMHGSSVPSALDALWANRLRSLLTILGVIVGVSAVIAVVTLTQGTSAVLNSRVAGLGTNVLTITPGSSASGGARGGAGSVQSLTQADADAIVSVSHVANASPIITSNAQVIAGAQNWNTRVLGVYPNFQSIGNWQLSEGSWFSDGDESGANPVAVVGQTVVQNLFTPTGADALGQTILISGQSYQVVGVLQSKGSSGFTNQDDVIYIPFAAAQERLNNSTYVGQIQAQVDSTDNVNTAQTAITTLLEQRHNIPSGGTDDFTVRSPTQFVQTAQQSSQTLAVLLIGIAAISLIVGGIGIMNIMLVSVTERTREIGIRMAVGARRRDIRNQFLIEALTLSVVGGLIGIALGLVAGYFLTRAFQLPFVLSVVAMALAVGVSVLVGVAFGFYPALRASRLDPIVALRVE
ncbi:MAG TPA: ABC transporter permease [Ktedonobacterales bacterium]